MSTRLVSVCVRVTRQLVWCERNDFCVRKFMCVRVCVHVYVCFLSLCFCTCACACVCIFLSSCVRLCESVSDRAGGVTVLQFLQLLFAGVNLKKHRL